MYTIIFCLQENAVFPCKHSIVNEDIVNFMTQKPKIKLFDEKLVRIVWNNEQKNRFLDPIKRVSVRRENRIASKK